MTKPIVYYVLDNATQGRIAAIAPVPLRDEDKDPAWAEMSITQEDWALIMDRGDFTQWYVLIDPKNNTHQLKLKVNRMAAPPIPPKFPNEVIHPAPEPEHTLDAQEPTEIPDEHKTYRLLEALRFLDKPELLLDHQDGWIVLRKAYHPLILGGKLDLWLTEEQSQYALVGNISISLDEEDFGDGPAQLFPIQPIKTTLYYIGCKHRIKDVRPA